MTRDKGNRAGQWVASYLRDGLWYPFAEATPNGRKGRDILGIPGLGIEVKTGSVWRNEWLAQCRRNAIVRVCACRQVPEMPLCEHQDLPVLIYLPPGVGETNVGNAQMIFPVHDGLDLLKKAGY